MNAFTHRVQRLNRAVERALANATATWNDGEPFGALFDQEQEEGFVGDVTTVTGHTVSMCVANAPGIAEGSTALHINGQPVRVTGAVVPDASGWATFAVVIEGGGHVGP